MKSCRNLERVIVYGLVAVLMAAFSFSDLSISEAVADQYGSVLGILGALYAETPFTFLSAVSAAILFRFRPRIEQDFVLSRKVSYGRMPV